ncbi:MAG TPA: MotA/TolQ/ExbB proton channel family protein, partial [Desulfohalobiaceae bacterium]|nr:MotA/TolQ/ExbB proton channel family protein [Desulfohalobiaceae bacterium]
FSKLQKNRNVPWQKENIRICLETCHKDLYHMDIGSKSEIFSMLFGATFVVQIVLAVLLIMSVISWGLIFYKLFLLNKVKRGIRNEFKSFNSSKDLASALRLLKRKSDSRLYTIGARAIGEIKALERSNLSSRSKVKVGSDNVRRVLRQVVSSEVNRLAYALSFLATCSNAAPFIGLFGTVWGIMHAFQSISLQKSAALATVAPGIAEALVATAFGLAVAIPASIAYNSFLGVLHSIESELINFAGAFLNRAQRELPWLTVESEQSDTDYRVLRDTMG